MVFYKTAENKFQIFSLQKILVVIHVLALFNFSASYSEYHFAPREYTHL
jgi:hypothetical protein